MIIVVKIKSDCYCYGEASRVFIFDNLNEAINSIYEDYQRTQMSLQGELEADCLEFPTKVAFADEIISQSRKGNVFVVGIMNTADCFIQYDFHMLQRINKKVG